MYAWYRIATQLNSSLDNKTQSKAFQKSFFTTSVQLRDLMLTSQLLIDSWIFVALEWFLMKAWWCLISSPSLLRYWTNWSLIMLSLFCTLHKQEKFAIVRITMKPPFWILRVRKDFSHTSGRMHAISKAELCQRVGAITAVESNGVISSVPPFVLIFSFFITRKMTEIN